MTSIESLLDHLDVELFIGQVKCYPVLWNAASEDYHNRIKKRNAWTDICKVFCEEFEGKCGKEKTELYAALVKKWRNIKDHFYKSLRNRKTKSGQTRIRMKRYIYDRQLSFLKEAGASTNTRISRSSPSGGDTHHCESVKNLAADHTPGSHSKADTYNIRPLLYKYDNKSEKRKRDFEASLTEFLSAPIHNAPEPNADRSFFESLLPSLSGFTEDEKLEFRADVLNLVRKIRLRQNQTKSPQQHVHSHFAEQNQDPGASSLSHLNEPHYSQIKSAPELEMITSLHQPFKKEDDVN